MRSPKHGLDPIEEVYLYGHPNPGRIDCPGEEVLKGLASKKLPIGHPARKHIVRCSPCWQEFRSFQAELRHARYLKVLSSVAAALLLAIASLWIYRHSRPEQKQSVINVAQKFPPGRTPPGILNFQTIATARGGGTNPPSQTKDQIISRSVRELAIVLPTGREAGTYVLDILSDSGERKLASYVGHASIDNEGVTTLRTPVDFKSFSPGTYTLSWHVQHSDFVQTGRFTLQ
jgi:hypothetical protein